MTQPMANAIVMSAVGLVVILLVVLASVSLVRWILKVNVIINTLREIRSLLREIHDRLPDPPKS